MTREQAREAAQVMIGWADGRKIQYKSMLGDVWIDLEETDKLPWDWTLFIYRLKPTLRPWTADEVPLGAWMRLKNKNATRSLITNVQHMDLVIIFQEREHSTDGGKTWLPCGVEEVGK